MGTALDIDLTTVRIHPRSEVADAIGAEAFTVGDHIHFAQDRYQPRTDKGRELVAHELAHVVQQREGRVEPTVRMGGLRMNEESSLEREADAVSAQVSRSRPAAGGSPRTGQVGGTGRATRSGSTFDVIQKRDTKFTPFVDNPGSEQNASLNGLTLDTLIESGLVYNKGGTKGNSVNLEKMIKDNGGDSAPGEPADITTVKAADKDLVRARGQQNAATAMHAINHNFADPESTNLRAENIFMGSARSNTKLHFFLVEKPIRDSMQKATAGNAKKYETNLKAKPGTPLTSDSDVLAWNDPTLDIPGVKANPLSMPASAPLPQVTHTIDMEDLEDVEKPWPKMIQYTVVPKYTYNAYPGLPQFLLDNIQDAQNLVDQENLQPTPRPNQQEIDNEVAAINIVKNRGHLLFPEDFTCAAVYWFPTYKATDPWYISSEDDIYSAEA